MVEIKGPFDLREWRQMLYLRKDIDWMKKYNRTLFDNCINKETNIYREYTARSTYIAPEALTG